MEKISYWIEIKDTNLWGEEIIKGYQCNKCKNIIITPLFVSIGIINFCPKCGIKIQNKTKKEENISSSFTF